MAATAEQLNLANRKRQLPPIRHLAAFQTTPPAPWAWIAGNADRRKQLYHSVLVRLPDGSSCYLPAEPLLWFAACRLAQHGIAPELHVTEQLVPALDCVPEMLLDIARDLSWGQVRQLAQQPLWGGSLAVSGAEQWGQAHLSLNTYRFE